MVNVRVLTTNAVGNDEWVGIDDIVITNPSNPTGVGGASPASVQAGGSSLLTVAVTPGSSPMSTGLAVVGNLSSIGGSATQTFYDDGTTGGDVTSGDNVFTWDATVSLHVPRPQDSDDDNLRRAEPQLNCGHLATGTPGDDPSGVGASAPSTVEPGGTSLLTVTVTPGDNPPAPAWQSLVISRR